MSTAKWQNIAGSKKFFSCWCLLAMYASFPREDQIPEKNASVRKTIKKIVLLYGNFFVKIHSQISFILFLDLIFHES